MAGEINTLSQDEAWVMQEYRRAKDSGFAQIVIKVHAGIAETITVEQKFRRIAGMRVQLKD